MSFSSVALTDITPATTAAWVDVDLDSFVTVPAGAIGALVVMLNDTAGDLAEPATGCRANGSTDNRTPVHQANSWRMHAVLLDALHIIEIYVSAATTNVYIAGFFGAESAFFTNGVAKSLATSLAWTDIDISADTGADTAIGAYFEAASVGGARIWGFRKNGSTDARTGSSNKGLALIGVDATEICEGYINDADMDFYLQGYCKSGAAFATNATDKSIATTAAYADADTLDAGKSHGIYEFHGAGNSWLRKKGATDDIYYRPETEKQWSVIEGNVSRIVEGKISATTADWFRVAQFDAAGGDTTLGASGLLAVAVAGALSTSITPAASASATVTAQASLSTSITLAAAATLSLAAAGAVQTQITPAGTAAGAAAADGSLSTAIQAAAAAQGTAQTAAALTTGITLAAAATLSLSTAAALDGAALLAGAAAGAAAADGALNTSIQAAGAAQATAAGTASLATAIMLAGAAPLTAQTQAAFEELVVPAAERTRAVVLPWRTRARVTPHSTRARVVNG